MSAVVASPTLGVEEPLDAVRALQRKLYRAAKADPGRRFHALYDKVHRRDVLERAWGQVRHNAGAPGIDHTTIADVERYGVDRPLDELEAELREECFGPIPARRVYIPKPDRRVLGLLHAFLRAGVMEDGAVRRSVSGTPTGRGGFALALQRVSHPARSGLAPRLWTPGPSRRRSSGGLPEPGPGRGRLGEAHHSSPRPRP